MHIILNTDAWQPVNPILQPDLTLVSSVVRNIAFVRTLAVVRTLALLGTLAVLLIPVEQAVLEKHHVTGNEQRI